jgi:LysR family transcriptional regulator, hydrogen peroxide-inducible genes activator
MLSLQQMQYILVLSEVKHFQRASQDCFVTQPTLSMQIKKAEDELGYSIFDRSRQPLEVTPFGEKLIPILREILSESAKITIITDQMKGNYKERIRLGIIPTIASYMIPDLFSKWMEKLEDVQLNITEMKTEELIEALEKKELDAIIIAGPHLDSRYKSNLLYTEEILAYIPNSNESEISTDHLRNLHPWLLSSGNCLRNQMISFCQLKNENESQAWNYEGGNMDLLLSMADQYGGYTLLPFYHHLSPEKKRNIKRIVSTGSQQHPAREVIAVSPSKSLKWKGIEQIIREIQFQYANNQPSNFELLNWK